jgi:hypothetical protein
MTCQQLGQSNEARKWLVKAETQYEQHPIPTNIQLCRLRREAQRVVRAHEQVDEKQNSEDSAKPETVNQATAEKR